MSHENAALVAIESKLAFHEELLQQLHEALVAQQARIDHLEAVTKAVAEQLRARHDDDAEPEPPPPHY